MLTSKRLPESKSMIAAVAYLARQLSQEEENVGADGSSEAVDRGESKDESNSVGGGPIVEVESSGSESSSIECEAVIERESSESEIYERECGGDYVSDEDDEKG